MPRHFCCAAVLALGLATLFPLVCPADEIVIPRRHDRPPNPPLSPEEAVSRMTTPVGFSVELVAAEPDLVNPVAMFIDEQGRFWVTESFEYPRKEPGPGRDRIKILEDTDGDGKVDKVTVFAEGLNIPSGIAVGYGGVWVCNAPDLLFLQDTDGDGKADRSEVILTGFGRTDTHELPNSLTWGPDGWLYGLNGVFNYSSVTYGKDNPNYTPDQKPIDFTCALFRVHPRTKKFEIFAEGTSNPWGLAVNEDGEFFISACVIDHLWHVVENGYYIRQGGPYPPYTWAMRSIVNHKHQKAAYCGLVWFDSDAYPAEYRGVLYMGNIHGACLNADIAERSGATYQARPHSGFPPKPGTWDQDDYGTIAKAGTPDAPKLADLMTANDAWFMPVSQKVGPDGCIYVLDWYDRYHCYQDATADPDGVDRGKGRLYRLNYKGVPRVAPFDLNKKTDDELIGLLGSPNIYMRETAQRLLAERDNPKTAIQLETLAVSDSTPRSARMHSIWARAGFSDRDEKWRKWLVSSEFPVVRSWGIRLLTEYAQRAGIPNGLLQLEQVRLQVMTAPEHLQILIAAQKEGKNALPLMLQVAALSNDLFIDQLTWNGLVPLLLEDPDHFLHVLLDEQTDLKNLGRLLPRTMTVICSQDNISGELVGTTLAAILRRPDLSARLKAECLSEVRRAVQSETLPLPKLSSVIQACRTELNSLTGVPSELVITLHAFGGDSEAVKAIRESLLSLENQDRIRVDAMNVLIALKDPEMLPTIQKLLARNDLKLSREFRASILDGIGRLNDPEVADVLLMNFSSFEADIQPKVVEVLTQRPAWALALLKTIDSGKIDKSLVNLNQLIRMRTFKDDELQSLIGKHYGTVRMQRSNRQGVISQKRDFLYGTPGDPVAGIAVFKKVCAQCHRIYGDGADVGPDITRNGRNDWNQLLQNVFDPSAVIGPGYQARIVATEDGRVLTGIPVEETPERLVLKIQGGKLESIPRNEIEEDRLSELSMMPEDLEKLMTPQELADLFAFLALDKHPSDETAKILPGAPAQRRRVSEATAPK
jgi:putative membrane-bound dehydrogenase domain